MSEDKEKIASSIDGLAKAIITAYVQFVNEHRDMDNASVVTAISLLVAITADSLTFGEDDPQQADVMSLISDIAMEMLEHPDVIRDYMKTILMSVMSEELRQ
jgi:transketolase